MIRVKKGQDSQCEKAVKFHRAWRCAFFEVRI